MINTWLRTTTNLIIILLLPFEVVNSYISSVVSITLPTGTERVFFLSPSLKHLDIQSRLEDLNKLESKFLRKKKN